MAIACLRFMIAIYLDDYRNTKWQQWKNFKDEQHLKDNPPRIDCSIEKPTRKTMYNSLLFLIEYGILQAETQGGDFV